MSRIYSPLQSLLCTHSLVAVSGLKPEIFWLRIRNVINSTIPPNRNSQKRVWSAELDLNQRTLSRCELQSHGFNQTSLSADIYSFPKQTKNTRDLLCISHIKSRVLAFFYKKPLMVYVGIFCTTNRHRLNVTKSMLIPIFIMCKCKLKHFSFSFSFLIYKICLFENIKCLET